MDMKKNYITKAYLEKLHDNKTATGVFFNTPKVIKRGVKYRKALSTTQKDIYEEFWDLAGKAAHKGQFDEKGRVYVEASYSFIAVALDISESTAKNNLNGKGKGGKYNELFELGLIAIKKRNERETSEYYVMAPVYEGEDKAFLSKDITTTAHKADAEKIKAKRAEYASNSKSKRSIKNEKLEDERAFDTKADNAEYEIIEREVVANTPDFDDGEPKPEPVAEVQSEKQYYFQVFDKQATTGQYSACYVCELNGKIVGSWSLDEFVKNMKLDIDCNRHESSVMADIAALGNYEIKYE